ncbi:MAG: hypothetical protein HQ559_06075, partial [Lentisphaerae bacterium]|nr:hypothetical protein [Lentisphaerota bacterium]
MKPALAKMHESPVFGIISAAVREALGSEEKCGFLLWTRGELVRTGLVPADKTKRASMPHLSWIRQGGDWMLCEFPPFWRAFNRKTSPFRVDTVDGFRLPWSALLSFATEVRLAAAMRKGVVTESMSIAFAERPYLHLPDDAPPWLTIRSESDQAKEKRPTDTDSNAAQKTPLMKFYSVYRLGEVIRAIVPAPGFSFRQSASSISSGACFMADFRLIADEEWVIMSMDI